MKLKKFFKNLNKKHGEITFKGFDFDSKKIKKNYIFFAIKGTKFAGSNYFNCLTTL